MVDEMVCVNMWVCVYSGKLDMGYVLFQAIQPFPWVSPPRPLGHRNTFCVVFPFSSQLRNIRIIVLMDIYSF